jgi:hypothetical protein
MILVPEWLWCFLWAVAGYFVTTTIIRALGRK